ncbi:MAG: phosphoribosylformylglycinamidine synthase [Firmicutes bacterium]|nr:phosphoribosylformylglycinamidine synthase [Bacillota bacterium]
MDTSRIYTEKKPGFTREADSFLSDINEYLQLNIPGLRLFNRYDVSGLTRKALDTASRLILSEPQSDEYFIGKLPPLPADTWVFCLAPPPDHRRSESAAQSIQAYFLGERLIVDAYRVFAFEGVEDAGQKERVKAYLINTLGGSEVPEKGRLELEFPPAPDIVTLDGFRKANKDARAKLREDYALALSDADMVCLAEYFSQEGRDPTLTELRVFDVYWSDHCRHSTFLTILDKIQIDDPRAKTAYDLFLKVNGKSEVTMMNIATATMRHLSKLGKLPMLADTGENNACTIRVKVKANKKYEDYLLLFKNETHNHPTEIRPYDGAHTCVGGAIRDPLSGRAYVYQGMRISGAADPTQPIAETLPGKLPQKKITTEAARGNSGYSNHAGLAAGLAKEIYHEGYLAKRMEAGALIGSVKESATRFETPAPGDVVILIGGRTGRDGIGAASSSSTAKGALTAIEYGTSVPKGEVAGGRKLIRLFKNPAFTKLVKRCNDFGAGGVSVAVGELSDGLDINLDLVPVKYAGLDGTDLAISESQERMAVVVSAADAAAVKELCDIENLEATPIAAVNDTARLVMRWRGKRIVNLSRDFLNRNGAARRQSVEIADTSQEEAKLRSRAPLKERLIGLASDLSFCSQKGIGEHFDASLGSRSVFIPGETQSMAGLIADGADTASVMSYGFDPYKSSADPFGGAADAVITSVAKLVAAGADLSTVHLSLQEFFPSPAGDEKRWGTAVSAILGAFWAQMQLEIAAIGGKDSMSGTYKNLDVPPTLISFAAGVGEAGKLLSPEFKAAHNRVYLFKAPADLVALKKKWVTLGRLIRTGKIVSAYACERGGTFGAILKMSVGTPFGFKGAEASGAFNLPAGSIVLEALDEMPGYKILGRTSAHPDLVFGDTTLSKEEFLAAYEAPLERIFPTRYDEKTVPLESGFALPPPAVNYASASPRAPQEGKARPSAPMAKPRALIPVFPGTNGEIEAATALEAAGGKAKLLVMRNNSPADLAEFVREFAREIQKSQMLLLPGGSSAADEPDGAGKLIVSLFRNPRITDAVHKFLREQDGLMLGLGNGFQALVKLGLLPYGEIRDPSVSAPTLALNAIGRFMGKYVNTRVCSLTSPWLAECVLGEIHTLPFGASEGRFVADPAELKELANNGQIAFQYCDKSGNPSMDIDINPAGSMWAIEGISSLGGRILGKMAHSERFGPHLAKNVPGNKYQPIFVGGVKYFK